MIYNHSWFSLPIKDFKIINLIVIALHNNLQNGNPCHFQVVGMKIVLRKSIDSGTMALFFFNLTTVDRGCQPLLAAHQYRLYKKSTQLAIALPAFTIPCYYLYLREAILFFWHVEPPNLLAPEAFLDILVEENKISRRSLPLIRE